MVEQWPDCPDGIVYYVVLIGAEEKLEVHMLQNLHVLCGSMHAECSPGQ